MTDKKKFLIIIFSPLLNRVFNVSAYIIQRDYFPLSELFENCKDNQTLLGKSFKIEKIHFSCKSRSFFMLFKIRGILIFAVSICENIR